MTPYQQTINHITPRSTISYGLDFFPSLEPHCSNDQDAPNWGWPVGPEISDCNLMVVRDVLSRLGSKCQAIMEIGVHRNAERSITNVLMDNRPMGSYYIGVDLDDKSHLDDVLSNTHTIRSHSHDQALIRARLAELGIEKLDIIMIDGWHSVNTCVNDWQYVDILSDHGVVILHDTNAHPGPIALYHAVSCSLFDKTLHCTSLDDMGIATLWRR
jgi:hypothetical protein